MGTPCRCCGKVVCTSQDIRFDHDRYNYSGCIAFIHLVQTISHNIDDGGYQQQSREEYFFQDTEPTACNLTVEKEEPLEGANPPVMVKTVTSVVRKFALRYSINDVYDWGKSNRAGHDFINSIFIRAGNEDCDSLGSVPVGPLDVPGLGLKQVDAEGRLYIASGRNINLQSMQDWNNLASGKPSYDFSCENQDEIFIEKEDINENNEYYILVECPEPSDKIARWGRWFDITKRAFIELRRITDVGASSASYVAGFSLEKCQDQPVLQDHSISKKEDLDDWHTLFRRTADGTYVSNNTYMDKEFNFGDFFKTDWQGNTSSAIPDKFFAFCGELQVGFLNPNGGTYLDLLYKIDYDRQADYVMPVSFPTHCSGPDDDRFTSDGVSSEFTDPLNPAFGSDKITITKSKSELGQAPTDVFPNNLAPPGRNRHSVVGEYVPDLYEFTPPYNNNVLRFKYNVVGGEDRFNGDDYIITEFVTDYSNCEDIKFLKEQKFNDNTWVDIDPIGDRRCPTPEDYFKTIDNYKAGLYGESYGRLKEPLRQSFAGINGMFIRPCVIESSTAMIVSDGPERNMFDTDVVKTYRYVPHYGDYAPAVFRFTIRNYEFYPYKLKLNDVNDACPKECVPTEHIPEWQLLESSFSCAGSPAAINTIEYGTAGGLGLNNNADIFVCCTKLSSDRQLMSCAGKYSINTSYAMRVANYVASAPSVWDYEGQGKCSYPKCELHREEDQLAIGVSDRLGRTPCSRDITSVDQLARLESERVGIFDVCIDGNKIDNSPNCAPRVNLGMGQSIGYGLWTNAAGFGFTTPENDLPDGFNVMFVGTAMGSPTTVTVVGSNGYLDVTSLYSESEYSMNAPGVPFGERRMAGSNRDINGTFAMDATEYTTGQLEYAKTCTSQSLDVEGFEIENEFEEGHNICILEVSFGTTFSLDKEVQKDKSDGFNARQQSDVVLQDPDCGEGLRWRVNTDDIGVYETLFDYDQDEDVSHACFFYEKGQLDLVYQDFVPAIEFEDGIEGAARMRDIATCVGKYLATLDPDEQFDYWYELANDVTLALQPEDDNYSETEIRSDEAGIQVLEIKKNVGDLVDAGDTVFIMKTGEINIRSNLGSGIVTTIVKPEGSIVSAGDLVMTIRLGDSIKSVLAPEDGEISAINVVRGDNVSMNQILAVMMTKKTIASPIKGAIKRIEVEVGDVVFNTQLMALVVNTVTFPKGSYVKVTPEGKFYGPFENHSMYKNENHYEVKDVARIGVDGVWAKGKPAEGKRNIIFDNAGIPNEIKHEGEDGYKFTFYTSGIPSAHAYDYGVKDDQAPELGDSLSEFFSDEFIVVFDEISNTIVEKQPMANDGDLTNAGFCPIGTMTGDDGNQYGDDVYRVRFNHPAPEWCREQGYIFAPPLSRTNPPPCGFHTEQRITGDKNYYKTSSGTLVENTISVDVPPVKTADGRDGLLSPAPVMINCYSSVATVRNTGTKRSGCRNAEGDLNFCDPCLKDMECSYQGNVCPGNMDYRFISVPEKQHIAFGVGLWMPINGPNQTVEFKTSSRTGGDPWDYAYTLGDSADGSYGETETYRCIESFVTLVTVPRSYFSGCFGGGTNSGSIFPTDGYEIDNSCLVSVPEGEDCPEDQRNANLGRYYDQVGNLFATYRKIVLKSEFNKCGDDRLPNLNYTHKDLVDTSSGDKKFFPQAVIAKSVELSEHDLSLADFDITEEQRQKINDKLSKIDKKIMRRDVDAPENISSNGRVNDLIGDGHNFRRDRIVRGDSDGNKVSCKPENYIPNLHAEKYGTVVDHGDIVQDFYDAVSDAGLSVPQSFPCGDVVSQAEKILNSFLYDNSRCVERMQRATRNGVGEPAYSDFPPDSARNWGRRFVNPAECSDFSINNGFCPEDPENVCTQVDENKPIADASSVEHDSCKEGITRYKEVMGIENYEDERRVDGELPNDYQPPIMPLAPEISIQEAPILKVEITKEMCSLKKYSFTIGD